MQELLTQIFSIYIAGITGLYKGVPIGFALHSAPVLTALFTALGSVTIVLVIFFSGKSMKNWFLRNFGNKKLEKRGGLFTRILNKYGLAGIGLFAPGIIGPIGTVLLGLVVLKDTKYFLPYLITGIFLWSIALTTVGYYSIDLVTEFL